MKHTLLTVALCLSFFCLSAKSIKPKVDSIPFKKWNFGIETSALSNRSYGHSIRLGMFLEDRISEEFSTEGSINFNRSSHDESFFGRGIYQSTNLDFAVSAKLRFGKHNNWFGKMGYYRVMNLNNNSFEIQDFSIPLNDYSGLQFGIGREFQLKNNSAISTEAIFRTGGFGWNTNRLGDIIPMSGLKVGYRF